MKKVLALLLVIAFGATFVAAEGVTFGAWTRTIYNVAQGTGVANSAVSQSMGPNWWAEGVGGQGLYASFNLNYQGAVLGYHIGWETDGGQLDTVPGHFLNFNVSATLIADLLTFTVGKISNDQFRVFKDATDDANGDRNWLIGRFETSGRSNLSNLTGSAAGLAAMQLVLAPKDSGLAIGVYMPLNQDASSSFPQNIDNLFVAASYTIASVGKITVGSTPKSNEMTGVTRNIYLGFGLTAVKGLDVLVAGQYNMNRNDTTGLSDSIQANLGASFGIEGFNMGAAFFLKAPMQTAGNPVTNLGIDVNPSYNAGVVSFGVTGTIDLDLYKTTPAAGTKTVAYTVFPWVSINPIGIKVGFKYGSDNSTPAVAGSNTAWSIPVSIDLGF